ncbi:MAG: response regulator transcription factor [Clostridiales bacterium]|jgi:DNA-binding response OmpR family regulator|nr:response regulator transcription factor [Clostridiales bacterium]
MHNTNIILIGEHKKFHEDLKNKFENHNWNCSSYNRYEEISLETFKGSRVFLIDADIFVSSPISSHNLSTGPAGLDCRDFASTYVVVYSLTQDSKKLEKALDLGADDFVDYPIDTNLIHLKFTNFIRRFEVLELHCNPLGGKIEIGDLSLDPILKRASIKDIQLDLTHSEFNILYTLYKKPDQIFSKDHLFQMVTGQKSYGDHNALMTHISRLRKKIYAIDPHKEYIATVRNHGYKISKNQESE